MSKIRTKYLIILSVLVLTLTMCMTSNAAASPRDPGEYFTDADGWDGQFFAEAAYWLGHAEIFFGDGEGHLLPGDALTRQQMALILARLRVKTHLAEQMSSASTGWTDDDSIADWARGAMALAERQGWFEGHEDGSVGPDEPLTFAQIFALLSRVTDNEHLLVGPWPDNAMYAAGKMGLPAALAKQEAEAELPVLRGEMVALTWEAARVPAGLDTDYEGQTLLAANHPATHQAFELASPGDHEVAVHFIDVGQGDAIVIQAPEALVLIDGGPRTAGETVVEYLISRGLREPDDEIDLVIATHPHADHIGGLIDVLQSFGVNRLIDSGDVHTTATYDDYLTELERQVDEGHCTYENPQGQEIDLGGGAVLVVVGPHKDLGSLNKNSVVARLDFGRTSFLFTGDAEKDAEDHLLSVDAHLQSDVLKVGHHGSSSSTTPQFLSSVDPWSAVICVGEDNRYGHPHDEVVRRLDEAGIDIFRTDMHGTVVFTSDGQDLMVDASAWQYTAEEDEGESGDPDPVAGTININTADVEQLQEIIHIGPSRAEELIQKRPFDSLDDLTRITGIGASTLQDIKEEGKAYVD